MNIWRVRPQKKRTSNRPHRFAMPNQPTSETWIILRKCDEHSTCQTQTTLNRLHRLSMTMPAMIHFRSHPAQKEAWATIAKTISTASTSSASGLAKLAAPVSRTAVALFNSFPSSAIDGNFNVTVSLLHACIWYGSVHRRHDHDWKKLQRQN